MANQWNIYKLALGPLNNRDRVIEWLQSKEILPARMRCPQHPSHDMIYDDPNGRGFGRFRCRKRGHRNNKDVEVQLTKDTWLENSKIIHEKAVLLTYAFAMNMPNDLAIRETSLYNETSRETISDWYSYCREVCAIA